MTSDEHDNDNTTINTTILLGFAMVITMMTFIAPSASFIIDAIGKRHRGIDYHQQLAAREERRGSKDRRSAGAPHALSAPARSLSRFVVVCGGCGAAGT
eukprot:scaffold20494_cov27-Tisochrysis_lutea.AAC.1